MSTTFTEYINSPSSEKVALLWIGATRRDFDWILVSGTTYKKTVDYVVTGVKSNDTNFTLAASSSVAANEWYFDFQTAEIFVNNNTGDPSNQFTTLTFRLFFSNRESNLPYDLSTGAEVPYLPYLKDTSKFNHKLDNEDQIGVSISGTGSAKLENNDGYWDSIYDKLNFENAEFKAWSYTPTLPKNSAKIIYEGLIEDKSFSSNEVSFKAKDLITNLREKVPLSLFDSITFPNIPDDFIGKPQRRIFGETNGLRCVPIDQIKEGRNLSGTYTGTQGSSVVNGAGSSLFDELTPGDIIKYTDINGEEQELSVKKIISDTQFTLSDEIPVTFTSISLKFTSGRGSKNFNREWYVAGHACREPSTTVTAVNSANRIVVVSTLDMEAGDFITINNERREIRRISDSEIVLVTSFNTIPIIGDTVTKQAVQTVFLDSRLINIADYSTTNISGLCKIVLQDDAEINETLASSGTGTVAFTNGSRVVTGTGTAFKTELRVRDAIKFQGDASGPYNNGYYTIVNINSDTELELSTLFTGTTDTGQTFLYKPVEYAKDNSIVSVSALGITEDGLKTGTFVKTASDAVKYLVGIDAGLSNKLNTASFATADLDAPYKLSLKIPLSYGADESPSIRSVIDLINTSIFGSLHFDNNFNFQYKVLTSKKPKATPDFTDSDIINWSVQSDGKNIVKTINGFFDHKDVDRFGNEEVRSLKTKSSDKVSRLIGTARTEDRNIYLFKDTDALTITQRISFLRESSNSIVNLKTKLNMIDKQLNDVVFLDLDRLFERFGADSQDKIKIGLIMTIAKNAYGVEVSINDLSNMFNKVANYAPSGASAFGSASSRNKAFNGYYTNSIGLCNPSDGDTWGVNLYG